MNIMGIDPSLRHTGIVIVNDKGEILKAYLIFDNDYKKNAQVRGEVEAIGIKDMYKALDELIPEIAREWDVEGMAIERLMMRFNRYGHFIEINKLIGWIEHIGYVNDLFSLEIVPTAIKKYVTGNGRATKKEIRQAIAKKLKKELWKGKDAEHLYDAYSIALTALTQIERA